LHDRGSTETNAATESTVRDLVAPDHLVNLVPTDAQHLGWIPYVARFSFQAGRVSALAVPSNGAPSLTSPLQPKEGFADIRAN
jgi:hypothetical protein